MGRDFICRDHNVPARLPAHTLRACWFCLENQGADAWRRDRALAVFLDGTPLTTVELPREPVRAGERVTLYFQLRTPATVGTHTLQLTWQHRPRNVAARVLRRLGPAHRRVKQFLARRLRLGHSLLRLLIGPLGRWLRSNAPENGTAAAPADGLVVEFETTAAAPTPSSRLGDESQGTAFWHFMPTQGVSWSAHGRSYPLFAREANGCRFTDLEGRSFIDYLMGYGCNLLGYAPERIQRAVGDALGSAGVSSLSHPLEMDVVRMLCEAIPCAETVLFGKNGSDVCTAAVRLARAKTGRSKILFCGYHGWQDWYVETKEFAFTGVPQRREPLLLRFPFNDLPAFEKLLHAHRGDVAGVILEPAGPVERGSLDARLQDADPDFLHGVAEATRRAGALLIFDEIMTGFRYPGGSVQKATGVLPDLACFGKALSAGMPLSALVGRKEAFAAIGGIHYGPTYSNEIYSLVAAREALMIFREHDVPAHIWSHGNCLKQGVNQLCRRLGAPAEVIGPPFRMLLTFHEPDEQRRILMRTLVQQELLQRGVLTLMGFMLPSFAHDDAALSETLDAFEHALRNLVEAAADDSFARRLEIPPINAL